MRQKPIIAAVVVILIVVAVGYYSYGDRYRNITADINSVDKYTGDAATTTRVKTALALNKQVSVFDIHVETSNNNVTLTGQVPPIMRGESRKKSYAEPKELLPLLTISRLIQRFKRPALKSDRPAPLKPL